MSRHVHFCISVRGALKNWKKRDVKGWITHDDGRPATFEEVREFLMDELSKGHQVIPYGKACEGFDYSGGGCPGHENAEACNQILEPKPVEGT